jgi:hypothetical protein
MGTANMRDKVKRLGRLSKGGPIKTTMNEPPSSQCGAAKEKNFDQGAMAA